MQEKEKIKQIYKKINVRISEDYIEDIMKNEKRVKDFMRMYKQEEIWSMNEILGKPYNNLVFTKFELETCSKIDLFDMAQIKWCKLFWKNRNNEENYQELQNALNERRCPKCI